MSQIPAMSDKYFRRQATYWMMAAGASAVAWVLIWLAGTAPKIINKADEAQVTSQDIALPTRIDSFVDLNKEVKPIDFSMMVRDLRSYPPEFKDKLYYENIGKRHVVELMDVAENDVIVDYLNGRNERKDFTYFRYLDNDKKARYILTYGKFQTAEEAQSAIANTDFGLPSTVKPKVKKASDYLSVIDHYMRADNIVDLATNQPRRIRLQATKNEIPVRPATNIGRNANTIQNEVGVDKKLNNQNSSKPNIAPTAQPSNQTAPSANIAPTAQPSNQTAPSANIAPTAQPVDANEVASVQPERKAARQQAKRAEQPKPESEAPEVKPMAPTAQPED